MSREIECHICGTYLGTIRDAKLRVGISHYCHDCDPYPQEDLDDFNQMVNTAFDILLMVEMIQFLN